MTVKDNISYGMQPPPAEHEIEAALKYANCDFIWEKPDQLLTMLTETGGGFSGGQKQRLVIARALIRKPDVMLLDEATSALDPVNEREVQAALDKTMKGRTVICIAHRLTTVKDADKILFLNDGQIVEQGKHDDLLKIPIEKGSDGKILKGWYHNQWETQFKEDGLTASQVKEKIMQLQMQIEQHQMKHDRIKRNVAKVRATGLLSAAFSRKTRGREAEEDPAVPLMDRTTSHQVAVVNLIDGAEDFHD